MGRPSKYSPELRERAVRIVFDHAAALSPQTFWIFAREFSSSGRKGCYRAATQIPDTVLPIDLWLAKT